MKNGFRVNYSYDEKKLGQFHVGMGLDDSRCTYDEIEIRSGEQMHRLLESERRKLSDPKHTSGYYAIFDDGIDMEVIYPFLPPRASPYDETLDYKMHVEIASTDLATAIRNNAGNSRRLSVARVAWTAEDAIEIIRAVTRVIGVSVEGRAKLIANLVAKGYFGDLKPITPEEQKVFDEMLAERRPPRENTGYSDPDYDYEE